MGPWWRFGSGRGYGDDISLLHVNKGDSERLSHDQSTPTRFTAGSPNAHSAAADQVMNRVYVPIPGGKEQCLLAGGRR